MYIHIYIDIHKQDHESSDQHFERSDAGVRAVDFGKPEVESHVAPAGGGAAHAVQARSFCRWRFLSIRYTVEEAHWLSVHALLRGPCTKASRQTVQWQQRQLFSHRLQAYAIAGFGRRWQAAHIDCPALPAQTCVGSELHHHRRR